MNPEIKKFWTDKGYVVVVDWLLGCGTSGMEGRCYWVLVKEGLEMFHFRGMSELQPLELDASGHAIEPKELPLCTVYLFEGKEYSEEEMLNFIK